MGSILKPLPIGRGFFFNWFLWGWVGAGLGLSGFIERFFGGFVVFGGSGGVSAKRSGEVGLGIFGGDFGL